MSFFSSNKRVVIGSMLIATVCMGVVVATFFVRKRSPQVITDSFMPQLAPWASIGGCGAGGSGGGGGSAKWTGMGVSGGLVDFQSMYSLTFGQNYQYNTIATRLSMKPTWTTGVGVSIPLMTKSGDVQYRTNQADATKHTGGLGDIGFDFSKSFGMEGEYSLSIALSTPTGQSDIKRGPDAAPKFLPGGLQKGSGMYSATLGLGYSKDVENGIWMFDASYSNPFNMHLISGKNQYLDVYNFKALDTTKSNSRFYYRFKPYGESDLGDYAPPSVSGSIYYGYKGDPGYVHSFGLTFAVPLGVAWMRSEIPGTYAPRPDPDHKVWSGSFNYGLEFSNSKFPIFLALSIPIQDQKGTPNPNDEFDIKPMQKWDAPDLKDLFQTWSFFIGIKATMF